MKRFYSPFFAIVALLFSFSFAEAKSKGHGHGGDGAKTYKILHVDPTSITAAAGGKAENREVFGIDGKTKVTINGIPAMASALQNGMKAKIQADAVHTAISVQVGE